MALTSRIGGTIALAVVAAALALLFTVATASADTIETDEPQEVIEDPLGIKFTIRVRAAAGLQSAELVYKLLNPKGDVGGDGAGTFTTGVETDVTFELETNNFDRYVPVGTTFRYHWEFVDRDGDEFSTPDREFVFLDGRYSWQSRERDGVTAFWYGDDDRGAEIALNSTISALEEIGALLETTVPYPVKVVVYRSEAEGELAQRPRGAFDALVNTRGTRVSSDLLIVWDAAPDVIQHEAAHIVTFVAGDGPFTSLPSWIDEGVAVFAQPSPGAGYSRAIEFALATDTTLSLREMGGQPNVPNVVDLFYGQAHSVVQFLFEEYGQEKFAELFRVHYAGSRIDGALMEVYGFDQNGLYNTWRQANGLRPITLVAPPTATTAPAAQATRAPIALPGTTAGESGTAAAEETATAEPEAAEPSAGDDSGSSSAAGIIIAVVTLVAALALGGGAFALLRREREPT